MKSDLANYSLKVYNKLECACNWDDNLNLYKLVFKATIVYVSINVSIY